MLSTAQVFSSVQTANIDGIANSYTIVFSELWVGNFAKLLTLMTIWIFVSTSVFPFQVATYKFFKPCAANNVLTGFFSLASYLKLKFDLSADFTQPKAFKWYFSIDWSNSQNRKQNDLRIANTKNFSQYLATTEEFLLFPQQL